MTGDVGNFSRRLRTACGRVVDERREAAEDEDDEDDAAAAAAASEAVARVRRNMVDMVDGMRSKDDDDDHYSQLLPCELRSLPSWEMAKRDFGKVNMIMSSVVSAIQLPINLITTITLV
jgi:hypothetical protein